MAMQLTNIARDVAEDWARGRLYIPLQALGPGPHAPRPDRPLSPEIAAALTQAVPQLLAAAEPLYRWGDAGLGHLPMQSAMAVRAARLIYSAIGGVIARRAHDVLAPRAVVPRRRKLWLALRAFAGVARARLLTRLRPPSHPPRSWPAPPGPWPLPFLNLPQVRR